MSGGTMSDTLANPNRGGHVTDQGSFLSTAAPVAVSIAIAAIAAWLAFAIVQSNVDVSWMIVVGERVLDGARLHSDIVELNPPFSVALYMLPVALEAFAGVRAELALSVLTALTAFASIVVSARILRRAGWFAQAWCAWLLPPAVAIVLIMFPGDFAQREHIAAIVLIPWLALLAARDRSKDFAAGTAPEIFAAGMGAAVFVMVKPPYAALALMVPTLWLAVERRSIRPFLTAENFIGAALTLAYLGWVMLAGDGYMSRVYPMIAELYVPLRTPPLELLASWPPIVFAALALVTIIMSRGNGLDRMTLILLLAGLGYVFCYALLGKVWTYRAIPFLIFVFLAFLIQLSRQRRMSPVAISATTAFFGAGVLLFMMSMTAQTPVPESALRAIAAASTGRPTIMSVAIQLQPAHPLTRMVGGRFVGRYASLWPVEYAELNAALNPPAQAAMLRRRDGLIAEAAHDLTAARPDIVVGPGVRRLTAEDAIMRHPGIISALSDYEMIYLDESMTVFARSERSEPTAP